MFGSDNFDKGDRALAAMKAYRDTGHGFTEKEGLLGVGTVEIAGEEVTFPRGYPFGDLIADMCHLMVRNEVDPLYMISQGIEHYGADLIEQAWENDDDWDDTLQSINNVARATRILEINQVPEVYHRAIFVKVGLVSA